MQYCFQICLFCFCNKTFEVHDDRNIKKESNCLGGVLKMFCCGDTQNCFDEIYENKNNGDDRSSVIVS